MIVIVPFATLAVLVWRLGWPRWLGAIAGALAIWGVAGLVIIQMVMRLNLPLELPTEQFLADGSGQVLDAGAGSGRSSLMVLLARPDSRVLALDLYSGGYGIPDNKPAAHGPPAVALTPDERGIRDHRAGYDARDPVSVGAEAPAGNDDGE